MRNTFIYIVLFLVLIAAQGDAQPPKIATDYEWELQVAGRTLFRDRTLVGDVPLLQPSTGGIFGKKERPSGRQLRVITDVSFIPGDTLRYFALGIEIAEKDDFIDDTILDATELPGLQTALRYILSTAKNIAGTEREDTQILFRSKTGWQLQFTQIKKQQMFTMNYPAMADEIIETHLISLEQLSLFSELIDLAVFELNRQGAALTAVK